MCSFSFLFFFCLLYESQNYAHGPKIREGIFDLAGVALWSGYFPGVMGYILLRVMSLLFFFTSSSGVNIFNIAVVIDAELCQQSCTTMESPFFFYLCIQECSRVYSWSSVSPS